MFEVWLLNESHKVGQFMIASIIWW